MRDGPTSLLRRLSTAALADLLAPMTPTCERLPPIILLCWCETCRGWMRDGSAEAGHGVDCGALRGTRP